MFWIQELYHVSFEKSLPVHAMSVPSYNSVLQREVLNSDEVALIFFFYGTCSLVL